jgi:alkanesulfonate monooxygenase SsuD/methylene tetrahydromethanopterin reductase-like flavin-dependent oxidoreductase (luciferase family)
VIYQHGTLPPVAFFTMRFDLRNPAFAGVSIADRYSAALDMVEFADRNGFIMIILSEHHASPDGYLPSAVPFAAAVAARTKTPRILVAALVSSFHDPLKAAEDIAVVDAISGGRLDVVIANGYALHEFEMFDRPLNERAARTTELVQTLQSAFSGEPFTYRGRTVQVTPATQGAGPQLLLGGSSAAAARRAARLGVGFLPSSGEIWEDYRAGCAEYERPDPGDWLGGDTSFIHIAKDVERGWEQIGPHALHEANSYGKWMADAGIAADQGGYTEFKDLAELRATGQYRVLTPGQLVEELRAGGPFASATLHPMMGGIPPAVAWESLNLITDEVIPALAD